MKLSWPERFIEAGSLFVLLFTPLAFGAVEPWSEAVAELVILGMGVAYMVGTLGHWELRVELPPGWLPGLLFLLLVAVQAIVPGWSADPYATGRQALKLLAAAGFFVICWNTYRTPAQARRAIWGMIGMGGVLAIFAIVQRMTWNGHLYWIGPQAPASAFGPFVNRAHFVGLMILLVPLALALLLAGRRNHPRRRRLQTTWRDRLREWNSRDDSPAGLIVLLILVMGGAAAVSGSRGGLVALLAGLTAMTFGWLGGEYSRSRRAAPLLIMSILIVLVGLWVSSDIVYGTLERLAQELSRPHQSPRVHLWIDSFALWRSAPMFGTGLGSFGTIFPYFRTIEMPVVFTHAESDLIQLLTDVGLVGVVLFAVAVVTIGLALTMRYRATMVRSERLFIVAALAGLFGSVVQGIANYNLSIMSNLLYLAVTLAVCSGGVEADGDVAGSRRRRVRSSQIRAEGVSQLPAAISYDPSVSKRGVS